MGVPPCGAKAAFKGSSLSTAQSSAAAPHTLPPTRLVQERAHLGHEHRALEEQVSAAVGEPAAQEDLEQRALGGRKVPGRRHDAAHGVEQAGHGLLK